LELSIKIKKGCKTTKNKNLSGSKANPEAKRKDFSKLIEELKDS
jgi:hypothetical protein